MIPHLAWGVISTVKTNFILWKILKIVLLPRNPWQHITYLKLNQPKIKATKFPQKIVCGNATDTALYISANGNAAETRNATSFCSYVFPPSGNVTETWTIRFPQDFRNTETPDFTLCSLKTSVSWYKRGTPHPPSKSKDRQSREIYIYICSEMQTLLFFAIFKSWNKDEEGTPNQTILSDVTFYPLR